MLYFEGKPVKYIKSPLTKVEKTIKLFVDSILKELGKNPYPIKLKIHPKFGKINEYSRMREWPGARYYACVRNIQDDKDIHMSGTWVWSERMPKTDEFDRLMPVPNKIKMEQIMYINKSNIELLFWFMWVYKDHLDMDYVLENKHKEALEFTKLRTLRTNVEYAIFNDKVLTDVKKRKVASLWGITGVYKRDIDMVIADLALAIERKDKLDGYNGSVYEKFLDQIEFDERTEYESLIRMCEDEMVISYEMSDSAWRWTTASGNLGTIILKVTSYEDRYSELVDYLGVDVEVTEKMKKRFDEYMKKN